MKREIKSTIAFRGDKDDTLWSTHPKYLNWRKISSLFTYKHTHTLAHIFDTSSKVNTCEEEEIAKKFIRQLWEYLLFKNQYQLLMSMNFDVTFIKYLDRKIFFSNDVDLKLDIQCNII